LKKAIANTNVAIFIPLFQEVALIGIEPSAILTLEMNTFAWLMIPPAEKLEKNCLTIEEFFKRKLLVKSCSNNFLRRSAK
jgi:hypothetical protein